MKLAESDNGRGATKPEAERRSFRRGGYVACLLWLARSDPKRPAPVLMPLAMPGAAAGLTYAPSPFWAYVRHSLGAGPTAPVGTATCLVGGSIAAGLPLLIFEAVPDSMRIVLAAGAGFGAMATTTAGNVLAIQGQPEVTWDARVALLQRYITAGMVIGLAAAGLLARDHAGVGFMVAGIGLLAAGLLAFASAPRCTPQGASSKPKPQPMTGGDAGISGAHHWGHHLSWPEFGPYLRIIGRSLRQFLIVWLIAYPAMNGFATLFPVAIVRQFHMNPLWPSCAYAIGVALSLLLYVPLGAATQRVGAGRMLALGIGLRLGLFAALAVAGILHVELLGWIALIGFVLIQFVWPFLAVGANSLSVRLAPTARGESVGLFNAATSLASALGSAAAGAIFDDAGFPWFDDSRASRCGRRPGTEHAMDEGLGRRKEQLILAKGAVG